MHDLTRRDFVKVTLGAAALAGLPASLRGATEGPAAGPDFGLKAVGRLKPRAAKDIAASPLGVGFETLDRRHFEPEKTYPYMAHLGAKWARCQTGWARTESKKGEFDFAWLDEVVNSLLKIGVQPWFNLGFGNKLYTPEADETAVGWSPGFTDEARQAWVRYTQKIAEHFSDRVRHWEIWNEPNITSFWKPQKPNARDYVDLVKITAPEIRKCVPRAVIIGGALAGVPTGYLKECMGAGLGDLVDKVSYHPYRPMPESGYEKDVRSMREICAATGKEIAIWQGENGAPSEKGGAGALANLEWNEARQARWLLRRLLSDLRLGIELTSYFLIVDLVGYRGSTNFKGLLRGKTYTPKPSYFAYQHVATLFDAETKKADLAAALEGEETDKAIVAAFTRRGRPVYAYWQPADLMKDWAVRKVALRAATADMAIEKPVLVDLLSGQVFGLEGAKKGAGSWVLPSLPLADYPLLVT
ncbi:MAG: beta-galactosidase, partial [Planctomycetota bacterium]|nr:beta-galactosidase [Planctomycetota bacterium]